MRGNGDWGYYPISEPVDPMEISLSPYPFLARKNSP
jgi:hypothetical protein